MRIAFAALVVSAAFFGQASAALAYSCFDVKATIVETKGSDHIHGTSGRDVIIGLGGDDTIWGLDDSDRLCGNGGNDKPVAGPGVDQVDGGSGRNVLKGGAGDDRLCGGPSPDSGQARGMTSSTGGEHPARSGCTTRTRPDRSPSTSAPVTRRAREPTSSWRSWTSPDRATETSSRGTRTTTSFASVRGTTTGSAEEGATHFWAAPARTI
jgi:Ca2+-binding RTX toxin-like protein